MTEVPTPPDSPQGTPPAAAPAPAPAPAPVAAPVVAGGPKQGNGIAVAGMILGIIACALFCIPYIALPCAIVGLILSIQGKKKSLVTGTGSGMAITGIILSIIALAVAALLIILIIAGAMTSSFSTYSYGR
ncbi:MAG: hypothetical protein K8S55_02010 [Phycisphaerae bacterium]|nr:hypothetical protein [Phycisphaerae bacterium]